MTTISERITHNEPGYPSRTYLVVAKPPCGTVIWNIGEHAPEGYIPFVRVDNYHVYGEMYAVKCESASVVMAAVGYGADTAEKMRYYVRKHPHSTESKRMKLAIPVLERLGL